MLKPADRWGPFDIGLSPAQRDARLRVMRAVVGLICGPRGDEAIRRLSTVEALLRSAAVGIGEAVEVEAALAAALAALRRLEPRDFRSVVASYAGTSRMRSEPARRQMVAR